MTQKTFKGNNPALQFITSIEQEQQEEGKILTHNTHNTHNTERAKTIEETKSKRLNLILQPSVVADIEKIAVMKRCSVNDLINTILKELILKEAVTLARYEEVFGVMEEQL